MPIRPEEKDRYPSDWPEISQRARERAGDRCQDCGVENRAWGYRDEAGTFHPLRKATLQAAGYKRPPFDVPTVDGRTVRVIEIVLTVSHLNHTPEDVRDENLRALCQRCHLTYDKHHHASTRRSRLALGDLFEAIAP